MTKTNIAWGARWPERDRESGSVPRLCSILVVSFSKYKFCCLTTGPCDSAPGCECDLGSFGARKR